LWSVGLVKGPPKAQSPALYVRFQLLSLVESLHLPCLQLPKKKCTQSPALPESVRVRVQRVRAMRL